MINELLRLTRPLIIPDTETTGTDPNKDRIIEIGFQVWTAEGLQKEWRSLVDPGVPIPEKTTEIHGITNEAVKRCKVCWEEEPHVTEYREGHGVRQTIDGSLHEFHPYPTFAQLAANLAIGFKDCDYAGKKVRFDLSIIAASMNRANQPWSYVDARIIDIDRLEQLAVPRTLSALHKKYTGAEHDGAHGALSDVRASATVIMRQLQEHQQLPRDLDHLHELQWPGWIDGEGKFRFINGEACVGQWGKHAGVPMRKVDRGYWDFILNPKNTFSEETKQFARNAKLGIFPQEKKNESHPTPEQ